MPDQPEYPRKLTLTEKGRVVEWALTGPAVSVAAPCRDNMGFRLLGSPAVFCAVAAMSLLSLFGNSAGHPGLLGIYTVIFVITADHARFKSWRKFCKGEKQHSWHLGTTFFDQRMFPTSWHRNRIVERFIDPLFFMGWGVLVWSTNFTFLGGWLVFGGFSLAIVEACAHQRQLSIQMDLMDGLVDTEMQGSTVERFSEPSQTSAQPAEAIPTGLAADIQDKISRQPRKPPGKHNIN